MVTAVPNVPDDFKEVLEIAQKGGDWRTYLSETQIDWSKQNPEKVYEELMKQYFVRPDGSLDEENYLSYIDSKPAYEKRIEGTKMIQQEAHAQQQRQLAWAEQKAQAQQKAARELAQATQRLSELLPVKDYGIEFGQKHIDELYRGISNDMLLKKHLLNEQGGYDANKLVKTIAFAEYGEKMLKFKSQNAAVQAKKELLQSTQNVKLDKPSAPAEPTVARAAKDLTAKEKMEKYFADQREKGRL